MPRKCTVCVSDSRDEIDRAIVNGTPYRTIADQYDLSVPAVTRHKQNHLPTEIKREHEASESERASSLIEQIQTLQADARRIFGKSESGHDFDTALRGVREMARLVELLGKLTGELDERNQVNVTVSQQWTEIRVVVLQALEPYPEAREAVVDALQALDGGNDAG